MIEPRICKDCKRNPVLPVSYNYPEGLKHEDKFVRCLACYSIYMNKKRGKERRDIKALENKLVKISG